MNQQCSAIVRHWLCSQCLSLAITHALSLITTDQSLDRLSDNQTLPHRINSLQRMLSDPLLQHCQDSVINKTKVGYVKKPQVWYV